MINEFVLIVLWMGICAIFAKYSKIQRTELVEGVGEERFPMYFALIVLAPLIIMIANRSFEIGDTLVYKNGFVNMPSEFSKIGDYMSTITKDSWFYLFSVVIKCVIGENIELYFGIIAVLQIIPLIYIYRKYSVNYVVSAFLFIASADYISWNFNGIRQFLAVTFIFMAFPLLLKKKYVPLILIILFASMFHKSALLMIPIIFIVQGEAWNKKTIAIIIFSLFVLFFVSQFTDVLDKALSDTQYSNVVADYKSWNDDGTNPFRVAVYCIPAVISFIYRGKIKGFNNRVINICTNLSIVTAGMYIISMVTSGIFLGRLPIFTSLFNYILLPWEIENLFYKDNKRIVFVAMVVLYLIYYYYQASVIWSLF